MSGRFTLLRGEVSEISQGQRRSGFDLKSPSSYDFTVGPPPPALLASQTVEVDDEEETLCKQLLTANSANFQVGKLRDRLRRLFKRRRPCKEHSQTVSSTPNTAVSTPPEATYSLSRPLSRRCGSSLALLTAESDGCVGILKDTLSPSGESLM